MNFMRPISSAGKVVSVMLCIAVFACSSAFGQARGGTNYAWFQVDLEYNDDGILTKCIREPYGVLANYHTNKAAIDQQLQQMYDAGQRRLRIPIYHARNLNSGTIMDSAGGNLSLQHRQNLQNFLSAVKATGFSEVMVGFFPQSVNTPKRWTSWSEELFQENWNLIYNLRPIIAGAGIHYRIDLLNEGIPVHGKNEYWAQYAWKLWANYTYRFGRNDTLGFSMIGDHNFPSRVDSLSSIYNGVYPYLFSIHFYRDEYNNFLNANRELINAGLGGQGWIVGEVYFNDSVVADRIRNAMTVTSRTVFYLTQWPTTYWAQQTALDARCSDVSVSAPASDFSYYIQQGF